MTAAPHTPDCKPTGQRGWHWLESVVRNWRMAHHADQIRYHSIRYLQLQRQAKKHMDKLQQHDKALYALRTTCEDGFGINSKTWHRTAAQRAEAFCRVLWPEKFDK